MCALPIHFTDTCGSYHHGVPCGSKWEVCLLDVCVHACMYMYVHMCMDTCLMCCIWLGCVHLTPWCTYVCTYVHTIETPSQMCIDGADPTGRQGLPGPPGEKGAPGNDGKRGLPGEWVKYVIKLLFPLHTNLCSLLVQWSFGLGLDGNWGVQATILSIMLLPL